MTLTDETGARRQTIRRGSHILTGDEVDLGIARQLYHRQDEIDPDLKLYASYLQTRSLESGDDYYIPTDFIAAIGEDGGPVRLSVDYKFVLNALWSRMPDFIAYGGAILEELPL